MNLGGSVLDSFRRKMGQAYRKSLGVYHFKIGHQQYHKKPGVVPLHLKEAVKKDKSTQARNRIREMERNSPYPYGKWIGNKFVFDERKMPFYNVPDLSVHTPKIDKAQLDYVRKLNDYSLPENFGRFLQESSIDKGMRLQLEAQSETVKSKKESKSEKSVALTK